MLPHNAGVLDLADSAAADDDAAKGRQLVPATAADGQDEWVVMDGSLGEAEELLFDPEALLLETRLASSATLMRLRQQEDGGALGVGDVGLQAATEGGEGLSLLQAPGKSVGEQPMEEIKLVQNVSNLQMDVAATLCSLLEELGSGGQAAAEGVATFRVQEEVTENITGYSLDMLVQGVAQGTSLIIEVRARGRAREGTRARESPCSGCAVKTSRWSGVRGLGCRFASACDVPVLQQLASA